MCAVLHGNPATRRTCRVKVGVSTPPGRCYEGLALGSRQTTRRAAVSAGVHTSGAEKQHNGAHAGQTSQGGSMPTTGRPKMVRRRCRRAHGWPALGGRGRSRTGMSQSRGSVGNKAQSCHTKLTQIGGPGREAFGYDQTAGTRVGMSE